MAQAFAMRCTNACSTSSLPPRNRDWEWDWQLCAPSWNLMAVKSRRRMCRWGRPSFFYFTGNEENMMAPDPSEFVTNDDHSSALLFRSRLFPAFGDYQIKPHAPSQ